MDPGYVVWTRGLQCGYLDWSWESIVHPGSRVCILELQYGFRNFNMNPGTPAWILGLQFGSSDSIVDAGVSEWDYRVDFSILV